MEILTETQSRFLESHHSAAMITSGPGGVPRAVRVAVALVDGKLWSSGTADRVRTKRLRRDPRCTLFVFDDSWQALTLETTVTLLEGADAPEQNLRLFRAMQQRPTGPVNWFGKEVEEEEFLRAMRDQSRLIYEFHVQRAYGL